MKFVVISLVALLFGALEGKIANELHRLAVIHFGGA